MALHDHRYTIGTLDKITIMLSQQFYTLRYLDMVWWLQYFDECWLSFHFEFYCE